MASFFTDAQKAGLNAVMSDMHDTWKRPIRAFKQGRQVVLSTDPNYSHVYGKPLAADTTIVTLERTIQARVYYYALHQDTETMSSSTEDSIKLAQAAAKVRIKVAQDDYDFLKNAERIVLDGSTFSIASTPMPHGLFGSGFYTLQLNRTT